MSSLPPSSPLPEDAAAAPVSPPVGDAVAPASAPAAGTASEDCGPQLRQLYPALFSNPPKPLKLRIQADIQAHAPGRFTKQQLSAFLRRYTGSHAYLNAIVKATHRFDLDGNPGDALSDEHRQAAVDELARRRANTEARQALENEQRANRATLLREFEQNTLPAAEFAASRGIAEGELEPLLERARKEAAEPPPQRDRRGAPNRGPRRDAAPRGAAREGRPANAGGERPEGQASRGPRPERSGPRTDGARPEGRGPRPQGQAPRGPREEGQTQGTAQGQTQGQAQGERPEQRPRPSRPDGDRPHGQRPQGARGPRQDDRPPRGPRRDDPRHDGPRGPRPEIRNESQAPTAMAMALAAAREALKPKDPAPAPDAKSDE